ncbi:Predicted dehydrogenase [Lacrimispora sphenoides]|uniref:Gfo/Idh/MocA family protein n=1 Tax=Lacrimispora sphenoides TaxID=29370 RepID=UPI0008CCFA28|nr:Gfo/Idh/MocA family oxidoreductase [Lacrimispora sphenoides]SEU23555.1 Predicted dehydrogenase [Lacrimispora sphenoides]
MKINYGIISTAAIGKRFIGAVRANGGTVTAAASRSLERARAFCQENNIEKAYGSYEELYQDPEITAVYITTINREHFHEMKQALNYGKHVLCEKPFTLSKTQAKEIFQLAKEKGLFVMEMQKSLFLPVTDLIKRYIDSGMLGKLHQVNMSASFQSPKASWMHEMDQGGVVYGSASYTFEYLDYLLEPAEVVVQALGTRGKTGVQDSVSLNIKMDDVLISSRISMRGQAESFAVFYFEKGFIKANEYWKADRCEIHTGQSVELIEKTVDFEMKYEVVHAEACIRQGLTESPVMTAERTLHCCGLVDQIVESLNS